MTNNVKFILLTNTLQGKTSQRDIELLHIDARSHAARVSHGWRKKEEKVGQNGCVSQGSRKGQQRRSVLRKRHPNEESTIEDAPPTSLPQPHSLLSQGKSDPFRTTQRDVLPPLMLEGLEYVFEVLWPKNCPALQGQTLRQVINQWRSNAIAEPMVYYAQVANAATLCYSMAKSAAVRQAMLELRLTHQNVAVRLVWHALSKLGSNIPSVPLMTCIVDMGVGAGQMLRDIPDQRLPEAAMLAVFNHNLYSRFATPPEHFQALFELVRRAGGIDEIPLALASPVQLVDVWMAHLLIMKPTFPLRQSMIMTVKENTYTFDSTAEKMRAELGTGFHLQSSTPERQSLSDLIGRSCDITAGVDQFQRNASGKSPDHELALQSMCIQHGLLSLPAKDENDVSRDGLLDAAYDVQRLSVLIYSALVFFPCGPTSRVQPRLAALLKSRLIHCFESGKCVNHVVLSNLMATCSLADANLLLWSLVVGGVACLESPDRQWYVLQVSKHISRRELSLDDLISILRRFLYWDFVFGEALARLYNDAVLFHQAGRAVCFGTSADDGDIPALCGDPVMDLHLL